MTLSRNAATHKDAGKGDATAFQHRHCAFVAAVIADMETRGTLTAAQADIVADAFAAAFKTNPKFDVDRLMRATMPASRR